MYCISDTQIDFILSDISARGVEMESLQQNLLDHICCIIEHELEENGDFEQFYQSTIERFYKHQLWEIEEETLQLLIFKNYYKMKKTMMTSGTISTAMLGIGLLFKFMHWPGAAVLIILGIAIASFIFLPLFFTLRVKEKQNLKDKSILAIGTICGILISLHVLFKIQHWPYANMLGTISFSLLLIIFLPIYFFGGIRNPETKVNTIVSSMLILLACGLVFTLVRSPRATQKMNERYTMNYLQMQSLLQNEEVKRNDSIPKPDIFESCQLLKESILNYELNIRSLENNSIEKGLILSDNNMRDLVGEDGAAFNQLETLKKQMAIYSEKIKSDTDKINFNLFSKSIAEMSVDRTVIALNNLTALQMFVLQN